MDGEMYWKMLEDSFSKLPYKTQQKYARDILRCIRSLIYFLNLVKDL